MRQITVVGMGYVGLVTAACFADVGYKVICLDIDTKKIASLQSGSIPIYEPGLEALLQRNIFAGRLVFTTDYHLAFSSTKIAMVAVDTPTNSDGASNLSNLTHAIRSIGHSICQDLVLIIKSTVPVGTASYVDALLKECLLERHLTYSIDIISHPEFLSEGSAILNFTKPDRMIFGVSSERSEELMRDLYQPFHISEAAFVFMDIPSSEMTKYAANAMLACRISFMNWMSQLCESTGADIEAVRAGIGSDPRIGPAFLRAGAGFGGSCFPKDIRALRGMAIKYGISPLIIDAIDKTNEHHKHTLAKKILHHFRTADGIQGKTVAILGLSFKPNTDDIRDAPSLTLIQDLLEHDIRVRLYDPVAMDNVRKLIRPSPLITWSRDPYHAADQAHAIALVTEWDEFKTLRLDQLRERMLSNLFFDGRNQFQPDHMSRHGFTYISIGRPEALCTVEAVTVETVGT